MIKYLCAFLLVAFIFINNVDSHSFPMSKEMKLRAQEMSKLKALPVVWSYHIHCLFTNGNPEKVKAARTLHEAFIDNFNLTNTPLCTSTFDDIRLCMFGKLD